MVKETEKTLKIKARIGDLALANTDMSLLMQRNTQEINQLRQQLTELKNSAKDGKAD